MRKIYLTATLKEAATFAERLKGEILQTGLTGIQGQGLM